MKETIRFSLNNKFAIWILTIIVAFAGMYSGFKMKMEMLPDINIPVVIATTVYPGASPEEIVEKITEPIEFRTRNLNGIASVTSQSMESVSMIILEYDYKKDMREAMNEVKEALDGIALPEGAQKTTVSRISMNAFPVLALSVSSNELALEQLTEIVEGVVVPQIQEIDGVDSVQISGQHVKEVELKFDHAKMASLGISEDTVSMLIQGSAISVPLGLFEFADVEKTVMIDGNIHNLEDLRNLSIPVVPSAPPAGAVAGAGQSGAVPGAGIDAGQAGADPQAGSVPGAGQPGADAGAGAQAGADAVPGADIDPGLRMAAFQLPTVKLGDIAELQVVGKAESISRTNGRDSIGISVVKGAEANTVEIVNLVKEKAASLEERYGNIIIESAFDQGEPIEESVNSMMSKALLGSLFAIAIILLFLRNFRSTLIAVVSIPMSIFIALIILNQLDVTLNIITLGAMTVAVGRVVDDSIVVIENIYRRMSLASEKLKGKELILSATREMVIPITSSTIVTIAVFLPLGLVQGAVGEIFLPFALTIVFALLASLLVAITIVPMLAHTMFKRGLKNVSHDDHPSILARKYKGILNWTLNHKAITFGGAIVLLVGSLFLTPIIGMSFLPADEEKMMIATYSPAPGEKFEDVEQMVLEAEKLLLDRDGMEMLQYSLGGQNPMSMGASSNSALFFVQYDDDFKDFSKEKESIISSLQQLGGKGEWKEQDFGMGGIGASQLTLNVFGPSVQELQPIVSDIMAQMEEQGVFRNIDSSMSEAYGQYRIVADQERLSQFGLAAGQIAMELIPQRQRTVLTTVDHEGAELNVYVHEEERTFHDRADLENTQFMSPLGVPVSLKDIATIEEGLSPDTISRRDNRISVEITADVTTQDVNKVSMDLQKRIDDLSLPPQFEVSFGGVTEQMYESFSQLGIAMLAAVAIVYFILVVTFGGGLTPFTILFSLPFIVIGALVGLLIAGETISVTAMIGALMLIGIVVTNAIVLIDRVIRKEKEGLSIREALLEAAGTRLRPILMTAIATIGALMPLAFGFESGGIISKGLGITVIGGLISSTLLTLIIVPIVYEVVGKLRMKYQRTNVHE